MKMGGLRSPLKYVGGKSALAREIVKRLPDPQRYRLYCEPMGGAAHVLLAKPRAGHIEIYNDLDNNLYTFWMQMLDHAGEMQARLESLPYARQHYREMYKSLFDGSELPDLERAIRFFYALRGTGTGWLRPAVTGWNHLAAGSYQAALELFQQVRDRLKGVAIDNRDALSTIQRYGRRSDTCLYIDPPYLGGEWYYPASKNGFPHEAMAALLQELPCYVAVSYYEHANLESLYPPGKWHYTVFEGQHKSSDIRSEDGSTATELLICNYEQQPGQTLWDAA